MTQTSLAGMPVALSISPSADLARLGLSELHLRDAFVECCRYVLVLGGQIVYGGDLRASGLLPAVLDLAESHRRYDRTALINFVPYPEYQELDDALERSLRGIVRVRRVPPPDPAPAEPGRTATAACLTAMRQEVTGYLGMRGARVLIGGQTAGDAGLFPGMVEEAHLAVEAEQPLYLIGMFGGAARALGELMLHGKRPAFEDRGEDRDGMTTAAMLKALGSSGRQMLRDNGNGLSLNENERLLESGSFREVLALTLTGLHRGAYAVTAAAVLGRLVPQFGEAAPRLLATVRAGERMGLRSPANLGFETGAIDPKLFNIFRSLIPLVTAAMDRGILGLVQSWVLQRPEVKPEEALLASIRKLRDEDAELGRTLEEIAERLRVGNQSSVTAEMVERLIADAALRIVTQAELLDVE